MTTLTFKLISAIETMSIKIGTSTGGTSGGNTQGGTSGTTQYISYLKYSSSAKPAYLTLCRNIIGNKFSGDIGWNNKIYSVYAEVITGNLSASIINKTDTITNPSNVELYGFTYNNVDYIGLKFTDGTTGTCFYQDVTCTNAADVQFISTEAATSLTKVSQISLESTEGTQTTVNYYKWGFSEKPAYQTLFRNELGHMFNGQIGWNGRLYNVNVSASDTTSNSFEIHISSADNSGSVTNAVLVLLTYKNIQYVAIKFTDGTTGEYFYQNVTCTNVEDIIMISNIYASQATEGSTISAQK